MTPFSIPSPTGQFKKFEDDYTRRKTLTMELKVCSVSKDLQRGRKLHEAAIQSCDHVDGYVANSLLNMYAKCGSLEDAHKVFEGIQQPDVVSWTALILGYATHGEGDIALDLFAKMTREGCSPDPTAFIAACKACIDLATGNGKLVEAARRRGKKLHLLVAECGHDSHIYLLGTLVDMYVKCRSVENAHKVFDSMKYPTVVCWNALILGYVDDGQGEVALGLFARMGKEGCVPDERTYVAVLKSCTDLTLDTKAVNMTRGKKLHILALRSGFALDIYVQGTLVDLYAKCGCMENARMVFDTVKNPNVVCWTALILGYVDNGEAELALDSISQMWCEGCAPNSFTFSAILQACGTLGALGLGRIFHTEINSCNLKSNEVENALLDFYAKCGSLSEAENVFDSHSSRNLVTWTALMTGYSFHGDTNGVFSLFDRMKAVGLQPDGITFNCILTACSHAGLVDKGKDYFEAMSKYAINPGIEHYTCMIDMFGRSNKLDHALIFLRTMHLSPNAATWMSILGACRKWKYVQLGRLAFDSLMCLETGNSGAFIVMANIYGSRGMWDDQARMKDMRMKLHVWKKPGQSWWTSHAGVVHTFRAGDKSHPQSREIHEKFEQLLIKMRGSGYVAKVSSVARNISDVEKEDELCGHSEKLAITCALINTKPGETIRIVKNLRVCEDCHTVSLLVSRLEQRTIVCRDTSRFHVFKDGNCSCGNFW